MLLDKQENVYSIRRQQYEVHCKTLFKVLRAYGKNGTNGIWFPMLSRELLSYENDLWGNKS